MHHSDIEWKYSAGPVPYEEALAFMEQRVAQIIAGEAGPCIWFLEHPPLYTAGTSAKADGLVDSELFPVYETGRGGEYTYHGPGQLVAYVMLDLKALFAPSEPDLRAYIARLEDWIMEVLKTYHVESYLRDGRVGVWVDDASHHSGESKIAAIGVRVKKWVSYHGICLNVAPDLQHYRGIVPCGLSEFGVTSLENMQKPASLNEVAERLEAHVHCLTHEAT